MQNLSLYFQRQHFQWNSIPPSLKKSTPSSLGQILDPPLFISIKNKTWVINWLNSVYLYNMIIIIQLGTHGYESVHKYGF